MGRKKKEIKLKEAVRIREKKLANGNTGLYLDAYSQGIRKRETLKLYLVPEIDATTRQQNINTRRLAEQIKAQRILEIQNAGMVKWMDALKKGMTVAECMDKYVNDDCSSSSHRSRQNAQARVLEYLNSIGKPKLSLKEVDKDFCKGFISFLETCTFNQGTKKLSNTTRRIMIARFTAALNRAVLDGFIERNPFKLLEAREKPQRSNSMREFLTIEEVKLLMNTPCRYEIVKQAFLFACFTGLRYSDVITLKWSEVHTAADGHTLYIEHEQVKTKGQVVIPLSDEAIRWMPKRKQGKEEVFHQLTITSTTVEVILGEWTKAADIKKHITFHCSRHTAATMLLTLGADLYTVSKILGHKSIRMTEVYAKIVDKKKIETMNLVNEMFNKAV